MYASCWICTKVRDIDGKTPIAKLAELDLGLSAMDEE
jgi:hypothetical protein